MTLVIPKGSVWKLDTSALCRFGLSDEFGVESLQAVIFQKDSWKRLKHPGCFAITKDCMLARAMLWVSFHSKRKEGILLRIADMKQSGGEGMFVYVAVPPFKKRSNFMQESECTHIVEVEDVASVSTDIPLTGKKDLPGFIESLKYYKAFLDKPSENAIKDWISNVKIDKKCSRLWQVGIKQIDALLTERYHNEATVCTLHKSKMKGQMQICEVHNCPLFHHGF